jgi:hypothetical protein
MAHHAIHLSSVLRLPGKSFAETCTKAISDI